MTDDFIAYIKNPTVKWARTAVYRFGTVASKILINVVRTNSDWSISYV